MTFTSAASTAAAQTLQPDSAADRQAGSTAVAAAAEVPALASVPPGDHDYSNLLAPLPLGPFGPCSHTVTYIFTYTERFIASLCSPMCDLRATPALTTGVNQVCLPQPGLARKAGPPENCCQQNPWHPVFLLLLNDSWYHGKTQTYFCLCFGHSTRTARPRLKHQSLVSTESGLVRA